MALALIVFVVMYVLLLIFSEKRWIIALAAATIFLALGILPAGKALAAINWNVLMMLTGTMVIVELFVSGFILLYCICYFSLLITFRVLLSYLCWQLLKTVLL